MGLKLTIYTYYKIAIADRKVQVVDLAVAGGPKMSYR
jgi:hypothetical protein